MIGASLQPRSPSITSTPSMSGQPEVEDHRVGGCCEATVSAVRPSAATVDLVVPRSEVDPQRLPQAALVLDDQHPCHRISPAQRRRRASQADPHRQAAAGRRVRDDRPVHRLDEAAGDREPEPDAARITVVEALERLEQPASPLGVEPRPVVDDLELGAARAGVGTDLHWPVAGPVT